MTDVVSREVRSRIMARVRSKDTKPEMMVRRLLHGLGYRYRLHRSDLPGRPDLVFPRRSKIVFVHGCFWHSHSDCPNVRLPTSNQDYWSSKLESNKERDKRNLRQLESAGWMTTVVWECELGDLESVASRLVAFLGNSASYSAH